MLSRSPLSTNPAEAGSEPSDAEVCECCAGERPLPELATPEAGANQSLVALYDEVDWVTLGHLPIPSSSRGRIARQVEAVRRVPFQLALAALEEQPQVVEQELQEWLGPQGDKLQSRVGLIEVFAGAPAFESNASTVGDLSQS